MFSMRLRICFFKMLGGLSETFFCFVFSNRTIVVGFNHTVCFQCLAGQGIVYLVHWPDTFFSLQLLSQVVVVLAERSFHYYSHLPTQPEFIHLGVVLTCYVCSTTFPWRKNTLLLTLPIVWWFMCPVLSCLFIIFITLLCWRWSEGSNYHSLAPIYTRFSTLACWMIEIVNTTHSLFCYMFWRNVNLTSICHLLVSTARIHVLIEVS
jgi:hypothetical protein